MANTDMIAPMAPTDELPVVRKIGMRDLGDALRKGIDDFKAMPTHVVFLSLIYPVIGVFLGCLTFGYNVFPLLYPLAAGFALVGPLAAVGLYELSRRRELGLDTSWAHAFDVLRSPSLLGIALLGGLLLLVFIIWVAIAQHLFLQTFGYGGPTSLSEFANQILFTAKGHYLIVVGNAVGLIFAILVLEISVVSFPLLLDRNVGAPVAMLTSMRVVLRNPLVLAAWGLIVACSLAVGFLTALVGLAIIVPILGHATWHLYRKAVEPDPHPRPEYQPKPHAIHYAAEFPSSLFFPSGWKRPDAGEDRPQ